MLSAENVFDVYVFGIVVEAATYELILESSPDTCPAGRDRFGRAVILATDVVAASWVMKRASKSPLDQYRLVEP